MKCKSPIDKNGLKLPCGVCPACRINETTDWSVRALFELHDYDTASFVTLTYDNEHRPYTLEPDMLSDYFDRFQHKVKYEKGINLRFFACGEYGDRSGREHYHAIMFGLNPDPFNKNNDRKLIAESWKLCDPHLFDWNPHDFNKNAINFVTRETIQYVAGYVQKKLKSYDGELYEQFGMTPPFKKCSKGLGFNYAKENADVLRNNGFTYYNGHKVRIPRYFRDKLDIKKDFAETEEDEAILAVKLKQSRYELERLTAKQMMEFANWCTHKGLSYNELRKIENASVCDHLYTWFCEEQKNQLCAKAEREFQFVRHLHKGAI